MPSALRQRKPSIKRQTWPQSELGQLETIIESPRAPQEGCVPSSKITDAASDGTQLGSKPDIRIDGRAPLQDMTHTQMIWYSHHLAESYTDRERLAGKIEQLENVCRYQSKTNGTLLEDIRSWQKNYESVEAELIDTAQELEEAKLYVRSIETANANLRYALSQAKEEQRRTRMKKRDTCLPSCWKHLRCFSRRIRSLACGASPLKSTSPFPDQPTRVVNLSSTSISKAQLFGSKNCSKSSQLTLHQPEVRQVNHSKVD